MDKLPTGAVLEKLTSPSSHSTLPTKPANASLRQALADRLTLSEAIEAVGRMVAAQGSGRPHDERGYIGAIAAALMQYPRMIALRCADPLRGVKRETRFLPEIADIVKWCERETEALRKPVDEEDRERAFREQSRRLAEEEAYWADQRKARPTLDELRAEHGPTWGIVQAEQDVATRAASQAQLAEANERALLAEYAAAGLEPIRAGDGTLISLTLAKMLQAHREDA